MYTGVTMKNKHNDNLMQVRVPQDQLDKLNDLRNEGETNTELLRRAIEALIKGGEKNV
jgi:hypothetical protein